MLIFYLGNPSPMIEFPQRLFNALYQPQWIGSEFARRAIKQIDQSDVADTGTANGGGVISSPFIGSIPPVALSCGVRTLLFCVYGLPQYPGKWIPGDKMGDNVYPLLVEVSETVKHDIPVRVDRILREPWASSAPIKIMPLGAVTRGYEQCLDVVAKNVGLMA